MDEMKMEREMQNMLHGCAEGLEAPEKLKAYFAEILPEYDRDRVHVSDMKKVFSWFNTLVGAGFTEFKLPAEQEA